MCIRDRVSTQSTGDDNGLIGPAELYGALLWLEAPGVTPEGVLDLMEVADLNCDGFISWDEFSALLEPQLEERVEDAEEYEDPEGEKKTLPPKVEPYGAEILREIYLERKRTEFAQKAKEKARRKAYAAALDAKIYLDELQARGLSKHGANPELHAGVVLGTGPSGGALRQALLKFTRNELPLRSIPTGKVHFEPVRLSGSFKKSTEGHPYEHMQCKQGHHLQNEWRYYNACKHCRQYPHQTYICHEPGCEDWGVCDGCYQIFLKDQKTARTAEIKETSYLHCDSNCSLSLRLPLSSLADTTEIVDQIDEYSLVLEVMIRKLPPKDHSASILTLPLPPKGRKSPQATVSVTSMGQLMINHDIPEPTIIEPLEGSEWQVMITNGVAYRTEPKFEARLDTSAEYTEIVEVFEIVEGELGRWLQTAEGFLPCNNKDGSTILLPLSMSVEVLMLNEMPDWGTPECDNMERMQINRRVAKLVSNLGTGVVLTPEKWHTIAVTCDGQRGSMSVYLNGELAREASGLALQEVQLQSKLQLFGGGLAAHNRGGDARRLSVYNRVLTAEEVKAACVACDMDLLTDAAPGYVPPKPEEIVPENYAAVYTSS
eukprot:TRINITY_DN5603_c0_g1_i2.p1 TRINITY_DN5603_c0_g1~~TRINITY_DN5603_c0_g1_i2.p1  ORF type:complete len:601 (-),score=188.81 TRINITY_DN5603_c0_g1_i2:57-1859(-)